MANFWANLWNKTVDIIGNLFGVSDKDRKGMMVKRTLISDKDIESKTNQLKQLVTAKYSKLRDMNAQQRLKAQNAIDDAYNKLLSISDGSPFMKKYINEARVETQRMYDNAKSKLSDLERAEEKINEQESLEDDIQNQRVDNLKALTPSNQKKTASEWLTVNKAVDKLEKEVNSNNYNINDYERRINDGI